MQESPTQSKIATPQAVPRTRAELDAVSIKRSELANQLKQVGQRRTELWTQARMSEGATQRNLETRIRALDERAARIDQEILQADDAIATALSRGVGVPGSRTTTSPAPIPWLNKPVLSAMIVEGVGFVLLGIVLLTWISRRAKAKFSRAVPDNSHRFEQLQQSVDVIALEVERIAEGQRYVTKVLNEKLPGIAAGEREHIQH